jgi:hypothetical protein
MNILFENGEVVKVIVSFAPVKAGKGSMVWKPGVVVGVVDFGYEVLCEGEVLTVNTTELEKLSKEKDDDE